MKQAIPLVFKSKVVIDGAVKHEARRDVVDMEMYKTLKKKQRDAFRECEKHYFPSKNK